MTDPNSTDHPVGKGGHLQQEERSKVDHEVLAIIKAITLAQVGPAAPSFRTTTPPSLSFFRGFTSAKRYASPVHLECRYSALLSEPMPSVSDLGEDKPVDLSSSNGSLNTVDPPASPASTAGPAHPPRPLSLVFPVAQPSGPQSDPGFTVLPLVPIRYRGTSSELRGRVSQPVPTSPTHDPSLGHTRHYRPHATLDRLDSFSHDDQDQESSPPTLSFPVPRIGSGSVERSHISSPPTHSSKEGVDAARVAECRRRMSEQFLADRKARRMSQPARRTKDDTALTDGYVWVSLDRQAGTHNLAVLDEEVEQTEAVSGEVWDRDDGVMLDTLEKTRRTSSEFRDWERKQRSELVRRNLQAKITSPT
ncbi:hypothetical protein DB88DRAFT_513397 [Papiliotrema laurentii]|uniref:Uncharacterized protein n=1 Tax=Papiliotrema laurentii TaxID=5418 RepID=A0AAD9CYB6_PAPLA|nr:hypothetical protein DB88DRAFT_513397 [Papiliotrema laurentii]